MAKDNEDQDLAISYESLFEVLRKEKYRLDIQKLPDSFFSDVVSYINEKKEELANTQNKVDLYNITDKSKLQHQFENILKMLTEIYDRREKKIINLAINKARTGSNIIDTTNLLPTEKELFTSLVAGLEGFRKDVLVSIREGNIPELNKRSIVKTDTTDTQGSADEADPKEASGKDSGDVSPSQISERKKEESPAGDASPSDENTTKEITDDTADEITRMVRFTNPVPKFVGKELETYGPFEEEDIATLPDDIAELLIKKGRAEEINGS